MLPLDPTNPHPIPQLLKSINHWIGYRAGKPDLQGKFAKYPTHLVDGYKIDAHDPKNHVSFLKAYSLTSLQNNMGIGFVLNGKPVSYEPNGSPLYLVAIDIDAKSKKSPKDVKALWELLKRTYIEVSPSKNGYRLFCLSRELVSNRNKNGLEIYVSKRFLTVTGWAGQGTLVECTEQIKKLHAEWFPTLISSTKKVSNDSDRYPPPDTLRNRAWVNELLTYIDPDCDYETYRNVIWSIEATNWHDSEDIGRAWSLGAPERFSEDAFTIIRSSFDDRRNGISFGSLVYYAKLSGWSSCAYKRGSNL